MTKAKLTRKQALFCKEYLVDLNSTAAARRAGYSQKTAKAIGQENLTKPVIIEQIKKELEKRSEKTGINAETVLKELHGLATFDPKDFLDLELKVRSFDEIPPEARKAIKSFKVKTVAGEKEIHVTFYDRIAALELLGQHVGLFGKVKLDKIAPQVQFNMIFGLPEG